MNNEKEKFIKWMEDNSKRSNSSISKYASAVRTVSRDISKHIDRDIDLYKVKDPKVLEEWLDSYLSIEELKMKNTRGNQMYSVGLKWYEKYLECKQRYINEEGIEYRKREIPGYYIKDGEKYWKRDRSIVEKILKANDYKCEYNEEHKNFIDEKGNNYVEGHHLIPMKFQDQFEYGLDTEANIVSLCVVCHKLLHMGRYEEKMPIIDIIFSKRIDKLEQSGLLLSSTRLKKLYK